VLEQVAQHLLAPAERRAGATRGSMRAGPRVTQWTGPLGAPLCRGAESSVVGPRCQREWNKQSWSPRHICQEHSDAQSETCHTCPPRPQLRSTTTRPVPPRPAPSHPAFGVEPD
jgi:hypothetical protein